MGGREMHFQQISLLLVPGLGKSAEARVRLPVPGAKAQFPEIPLTTGELAGWHCALSALEMSRGPKGNLVLLR